MDERLDEAPVGQASTQTTQPARQAPTSRPATTPPSRPPADRRPKPSPNPKPPAPPYGSPLATEGNSRHVYFAVPKKGESDAFSGQFLRLEEYIGPSEDPHRPKSLSKTGLKGIGMSATGYMLVNVRTGVYETYGKALTEAISGKDHTITIEKGDWTLTAQKGGITIKTENTGSDGTMSFKSKDCDIVFQALNGKASTSDRFDVKTSDQNAVGFVLGFELSAVAGVTVKENIGFVMNINVAGDMSVKLMDVKTEAFPLKVGANTYAYLIGSAKFQLIYGKFGVLDSKTMIVYNKITHWQIYMDMVSTKASDIKSEIDGLSNTAQVAKAESHLSEVSMWQLLKM